MFNYILYRIGQFIVLYIPLKFAYKVAVFFSDVHYFFARKDRLAVTENLKAIFPEKSEQEIGSIRIRMFRNFAKYLADFFRFSLLDREYINKNVRLVDMDNFDKALAKRKGVIVLTAHIGNWELGGAVIALLNYPFWVVVLEHKNKNVNNFFNHQRESKGVKFIPVGITVKRCLTVLKQNGMVALAGDRDFGDTGVTVKFLGKSVLLPRGPAAFSLKTGSPIVPGFMVRDENDKFFLKIEEPIEFKPSGNDQKDLLALIELYKVVIEKYIRQYPDQWYMFRRFFIS
jgi:KDO2-lipid IV(A) lauroyltransferase